MQSAQFVLVYSTLLYSWQTLCSAAARACLTAIEAFFAALACSQSIYIYVFLTTSGTELPVPAALRKGRACETRDNMYTAKCTTES